MKKTIPSNEPLVIEKERDLRKNIRNINQRFNDHPEIAKLILINPILALQDIGVTVTPEVKQHIMDSLRFPPKWIERREQIKQELETELAHYGFKDKLPLTNATRSNLVFNIMKMKPRIDEKNVQELAPERLPFYQKEHPLIAKLVEYEKLKRGRMIFQPKQAYEEYKSGVKKLKWIKAIRFKV